MYKSHSDSDGFLYIYIDNLETAGSSTASSIASSTASSTTSFTASSAPSSGDSNFIPFPQPF